MDNMKEACDGRWKTRKRRCCCDVGRWKMRKRSCTRTSPSLPHEVIENILSRLPVKDLLRFRVVCKLWEATICDPIFAQIHLQQSKNPSSRNLLGYLLGWEDPYGFNGLHVVELRNNCNELVSTIEYSREYGLKFFKLPWCWCSCDELYLMYLSPRATGKPNKLVLWNPSRRMYRELYFPHSVDIDMVGGTTIRRLYYNPLMKDYKIIIGDLERYAVYSCRDNKWGDVKEMKGFLGYHCPDISVSFSGSIYWLAMDALDLGEDEGRQVSREVICFDCKDETFRRLPLPKCKNVDEKIFQLTSLGGQLCLLISDLESSRVEIMKKVNNGDEWMESKEECCLYDCGSELPPEPVCQVSENEILLCGFMNARSAFILYDKIKNTLVEILNNYPPIERVAPISRHVENLLLL